MDQQQLTSKIRQQMLGGRYKSARDAANYEAVSSQIPGRENGPADAYRHIIWIAETTRRNKLFLSNKSDKFTNVVFGHSKEIAGILKGAKIQEVDMDLHNNEVALKIGMEAESYEEVVINARAIIEKSDGSGQKNSAVWLHEKKWDRNPKRLKLNTQGRKIINPKTKQPEMEDVPEKDWNWGSFDWVNKVNYKDTHNEQDKAYNAVRKNALKAGEKVEKFFNDLVPEKMSPSKIERQGSLLSQEPSRNLRKPNDLVFVTETPREIFGALGQSATQKPSIRLSQTLRPNARAQSEDIIQIRTGLEALGQTKRPDYGIVPFVDGRLFDDIKLFQDNNDLTIDGVINPLGETVTRLNQHLQEVF